MTPAGVIAEVRNLVQDSIAPLRYTDGVMLGFVNQTIQSIAMMRPDLFGSIQDIPTQTGSAVQALPADALRLIDIFQVKNGNSVTEVDRETMNRNAPEWMNATAGSPVNFMRHVKNEDRFFLYPPPSAGVVLVGEYAVAPPSYTINETITAPSATFFPAVVAGVVFLSQSIDDEHVNSNRAKLFYDLFVQQLGVSLKNRELTDTKMAGFKPSPVQTNLGEVI